MLLWPCAICLLVAVLYLLPCMLDTVCEYSCFFTEYERVQDKEAFAEVPLPCPNLVLSLVPAWQPYHDPSADVPSRLWNATKSVFAVSRPFPLALSPHVT
jgi:hypothetical protein